LSLSALDRKDLNREIAQEVGKAITTGIVENPETDMQPREHPSVHFPCMS